MTDHNKDRCPVCGMQVDDVRYTIEYRKRYFHFCSEQCRDNFNARPQLYSGMIEGRDPVLKRRHWHLAAPLDDEMVSSVTARLREMMGVREVNIDNDQLRIEYDLLQVTQSYIENVLSEQKVYLDRGWFQRLRRAWARYEEGNELDNLTRGEGSCCNRPPPR